MTIGEKIVQLKERQGFKNYKLFGEAVGLPGDWLIELSKRDSIQSIDISRLFKIADYFHITLDALLRDNESKYIQYNNATEENDIGKLIDEIQQKTNEKDLLFYGSIMDNATKKMLYDLMDVSRNIIKQNL